MRQRLGVIGSGRSRRIACYQCRAGCMNRLKIWLSCFAVTVAAVIVAYAWIDRPTAFFAHDHLVQFKFFGKLPLIAEELFPIAVLIFLTVAAKMLLNQAVSKVHGYLFLCGLSLVVAETIKEQLKYIFGRTWPETWTNNNPSLIHDNVYGFNFFHSGQAYSSFPSGHTNAICAVMAVLWFAYPRYRALYIVPVAAVIIGLIGADFHFVSDIIAGGFIGTSTGWILFIFWQTYFSAPPVAKLAKKKLKK
jgi:membrane-associated phospholipid phosphatase